MSKKDSTLVNGENKPLTRRRFIQMAAAGTSLAAAVMPHSAFAARILYRQRRHSEFGIEYDEYSEINELFANQDSLQQHGKTRSSPLSSYKQRLRPRDLSLYVESSGEKLSLTYYESGRYLPDALREVNHLLRDQHNGDIHNIDPELLDQLFQLKGMLGISKKPFHVLSAYRSPETNARMHRRRRGVASKSLHMSGKAVDIRVEGLKSRSIRDAALSLAQGGVGYYPHSNFVHVDTGNFRTW
ncbi:MAG: DUF882 domain-containing protein [Gammaproteobacteria bacterium]